MVNFGYAHGVIQQRIQLILMRFVVKLKSELMVSKLMLEHNIPMATQVFYLVNYQVICLKNKNFIF